MTDAQESQTQADLKEDARVGYQAALELARSEAGLNWARFNAMVLANSIVIAMISLVLTSEKHIAHLVLILCATGLGLCGVWFLLMARGFGFERYYILSARELEEQHLKDQIKTVSRGGDFADKGSATLKISGKDFPCCMGAGGGLRARTSSYVTIVIFALLYLALAFINVNK